MSSSTIISRPLMVPSRGETLRRFFASGSLMLLIPAWISSALFASTLGHDHEAVIGWISALLLLTGWALLTHSSRPWIWLRLHIAALLVIAFYQIAHHYAEGYVFAWLYLLPMSAFFLFGRREGSVWVTVVGLGAGILMFFGLGFAPYPMPIVARFLCSYAITSALALEIELVRHRYAKRLRREKKILENTLADVELLRGFLPICASCKSIRDDRGFWSSLERYLSERSLAKVKSSFCPSCRLASHEDDTRASSNPADEADDSASEHRVGSPPIRPPRKHDFRQRRYLIICLVSVFIVGVGFGLGDLFQGNIWEGLVELAVAATCIGLLAWSRYTTDLRPLCQILAGLLSAFLLFELAIGGAAEHAFLWSLAMPPIFFALFGREEGIVWNSAFFVGHSLLFFFPYDHHYPYSIAFRLSTVLLLVALMALGLERSRHGLRARLRREKAELEQTLAHAETLHGILPMCPRCKNIRDDDGFWKQVEDYLTVHAGTQLSHGLCPSCSAQHFGVLNKLST